MVEDYETITNEVEKEALETHTTIQQLISRIEYLDKNIIPNLETYKGYRLLFGQDVTKLDVMIEEEKTRLDQLRALKGDMENDIRK